MSVSIVNGSVETATVKSKHKNNMVVLSPLTFRLDDGGSRTLKRAIVSGQVADLVVPGAQGRFYLSNSMDLKGVHGARTAAGSAYEFPGANNIKIFWILLGVSLALIALKVGIDGEVPLLGLLTLILAVVGVVLTRKSQGEARAQYDADPHTV